MSLFNELGTGRHQSLLTRLFNMVGGSPAPVLSPEIQPGLDLNPQHNELDYLQGVRWATGYGQVPAGGAGQYGYIGISNAAASGVLVVVTSCYAWLGTAGNVWLEKNSGRVGTLGQSRYSDFRDALAGGSGTNATPTIIAATSATAVVTAALTRHFLCPTTPMTVVPVMYVLPPGGALFMVCETANIAINGGFEFYVRQAPNSELVTL